MVEWNKMYAMVPVMLLARRLDSEDPKTVFWLRVAYGVVQFLCVLIASYTYLIASRIKSDHVVYVPAPAVPFVDNPKKKYTEIAFGKHVQSTARTLLGSTLFSLVLTCGLHYFKGMVMGLGIQTVMGPLNLIENALVRALFLKRGIRPEDRIFDEKASSELTDDDEVVDEQGHPVTRSARIENRKQEESKVDDSKSSFEEILLDTWDRGAKAELSTVLKVISKQNCNFQTKKDSWTPLMILSGLGAKGTAAVVRQLLDLGADPAMVDKDGWTALHWAGFHGNAEAAKELRKETKLLAVQDLEGHTPIELAKQEGNNDVAAIFEEALGESKKTK